jgi:hypothetical protein
VFIKLINTIALDLTQHRSIVNALIEVRKQSTVLLPIGHSFIPFDILLAVIKGNADGEDLTVKALFANLPYSDMGIRYHFRTLIKNEWIELHNGDKDTRIRRVKPTEKLVKRFGLMSQQLNSIFQ